MHYDCMQPLPTSLQPVFSMAMHGVVACFTQAGTKKTRVSICIVTRLMFLRLGSGKFFVRPLTLKCESKHHDSLLTVKIQIGRKKISAV